MFSESGEVSDRQPFRLTMAIGSIPAKYSLDMHYSIDYDQTAFIRNLSIPQWIDANPHPSGAGKEVREFQSQNISYVLFVHSIERIVSFYVGSYL